MKKSIKGLIVIGLVILIVFVVVEYLFFSEPFLYAGTLEATKIDLSARQSAAISNVYFYEGDSVKENQVVATLVCEDFRHAATLANENFNRYTKLEPNWTTPENIDTLRKQMEDANTYVDWCTIRAPLDARVLNRYHEPGEWMTSGTKILTIANIKDIWAYIYVPQPKVAELSYGMKLKAYLPELNNQVFEGTIIKINDEAEFTPKNVQTQKERERLIYGIKVSFLASNQNEILKPGMTVEVELPKQNKKNEHKKNETETKNTATPASQTIRNLWDKVSKESKISTVTTPSTMTNPGLPMPESTTPNRHYYYQQQKPNHTIHPCDKNDD